MPTYQITSGRTGRVYPVDFTSEPTQQDADEALIQIEAPETQSISEESFTRGLAESRGAGQFPAPSPVSLGRRIAQTVLTPLSIYDAATGRSPSQEALIQGVGATVFADAPEAIAARSGIPINEPGSAKFTDPYTYSAGEIGGVAVPLGIISKGASVAKQTLGQLLKQGARLGGVFGGGAALSAASKNPETELQEAIVKTLIGGGQGAALGTITAGVLKGTVGAASKIDASLAKKAAEKIANIEKSTEANKTLSTITKFSPSEIEQKTKLDEGIYAQLLPDIKADFKQGSGVDGFLSATEGLVNESTRIYKPLIKSANAEPYLNKVDLRSQINDRLIKDIPNPIKREEAIKSLQSDFDTITPENLVEYGRDKNREVHAYYKNPDINRADTFFAAKAARDVYSDIVKTILKDNNVDPNIYSRTGNLMEIADEVGNNYLSAKYQQSQLEGTTLGRNIKKGLAGTKTIRGGIGKGISDAAAPYLSGEPKFYNDQINRMFSQVKKAPSLNEAERFKLLSLAQEQLKQSREKPVPPDLASALERQLREQVLAEESSSLPSLPFD